MFDRQPLSTCQEHRTFIIMKLCSVMTPSYLYFGFVLLNTICIIEFANVSDICD